MSNKKVPFVDEVEEFNGVMGKSYQNPKTPKPHKYEYWSLIKFTIQFSKNDNNY